MAHIRKILATLFAATTLVACGGSDTNNSNGITESTVSIGFSDYPVEGAEKVVITVDTLTFISDGETIVVDTFTSEDLDVVDADTVTIDLLEVQNDDFKLVLDSVVLPVGNYTDLRIGILDEDTNLTYVEEIEGSAVKELKVPSDEIKLGAFTVDERSTQTFIVEFDLRQAMTYNPSPDRYILKPRGVRIVSLISSAQILGHVDTLDLSADTLCSEKLDINVGNMMYLYAGHNLDANLLTDVFDPEIADSAPEGAISPYAVTSVDTLGDFQISFITPGNYTLAYSCLAESDASDTYDNIILPAPASEIVELTLGDGEDAFCGFPLVDGVCSAE